VENQLKFKYWEVTTMRKILSCEFNLDTACVELRLDDGSLISIDCTAVENEVANSMYQRSELDWLIQCQLVKVWQKEESIFKRETDRQKGNFYEKKASELFRKNCFVFFIA
jgi:hypothetical protein